MPPVPDLVRHCGRSWAAATEFLATHRTKAHALGVLAAVLLGRPNDAQDLITVALLLAGLALRVWALGCISKDRTLCTWGPYRYSRNPLYLGNALIGAGACVLANHWAVTLVWVAVLAVVYPTVIRQEEAELAESFGDAYAQYCAATPRFLPRLRAAASQTAGEFRLARALRRGLIAQTAVFILLLGAIEAKEEYLEAQGLLAPMSYGVLPLGMISGEPRPLEGTAPTAPGGDAAAAPPAPATAIASSLIPLCYGGTSAGHPQHRGAVMWDLPAGKAVRCLAASASASHTSRTSVI